MFNFEVLPHERFDHTALQRRRREETERKQRFFDPRTRILGVDVQFLDEQLNQKKILQSMDEQRSEAFEKASGEHRQVLDFLEKKREMERRSYALEIDQVRKEQQQPAMRREWDLNDPKMLKKELPARVGNQDARNTSSGLQKFDGEDLDEQTRRHRQKEQVKVWTQEQLFEKTERKRQEMEESGRYDQFVVSMTRSLAALEKEQQHQKVLKAKEDKDFNHRMAEENKQRKLNDKKKETEANILEIQSQLDGTFLCERPDVYNIGHGHKARVDNYKGMTNAERIEVRQLQEDQREQTRARKEGELREQESWAFQEAAFNRAQLLMEREKERRQKETARQLLRENQNKSAEDKQKRQYMDNVVYTNKPTEDYFGQFNTSSR